MQPAIRKDDRLQPPFQESPCDAPRFINITAPDAQKPADDRRIVEDKELLCRRSPIPIQYFDIVANEPACQFTGIGDCGR